MWFVYLKFYRSRGFNQSMFDHQHHKYKVGSDHSWSNNSKSDHLRFNQILEALSVKVL